MNPFSRFEGKHVRVTFMDGKLSECGVLYCRDYRNMIEVGSEVIGVELVTTIEEWPAIGDVVKLNTGVLTRITAKADNPFLFEMANGDDAWHLNDFQVLTVRDFFDLTGFGVPGDHVLALVNDEWRACDIKDARDLVFRPGWVKIPGKLTRSYDLSAKRAGYLWDFLPDATKARVEVGTP